jgi:hypothetical protein
MIALVRRILVAAGLTAAIAVASAVLAVSLRRAGAPW